MPKETLKAIINFIRVFTKICSTSLAIREMPAKTTVRYHYTAMRTAKTESSDSTKLGGGCGETRSLTHSLWVGTENGTGSLENSLAISLKN